MATPGRRARLSRGDWVEAALDAAAAGGLQAVSVEGLAASLGATKGSFYWHFRDREDLIDALLAAWEAQETTAVVEQPTAGADPAERLRRLVRSGFGDQRGSQVEVALLAVSDMPAVGAVLRRTTTARVRFLEELFAQAGVDAAGERALLAYSAYVGLHQLRRAAPAVAPRGRRLDEYVGRATAWLLDEGLEPVRRPARPAARPARR